MAHLQKWRSPGIGRQRKLVSVRIKVRGLLGQGCRRSRLGRAEGKENQYCMARHLSSRSKFSPVSPARLGTRAIWLLATTTGHLIFVLGNGVPTAMIHHHACIDRWRACLAWWFPQGKVICREHSQQRREVRSVVRREAWEFKSS